MKWLRFILFPISIIYWLVTAIRNFLFEREILKEFAFEVPVVNVGNLTVGGTGKTPFVEYLVELFKDKKKMAVLSRGYGRKTKGFIIADANSNATEIGDEPMQYQAKFGEEIVVAVGEDRVQSVPGIFAHEEATDLVVLDDAFQHRYIKPAFNILLTKYKNLFFKDFVLPAGNLRESRKGAKRANVVVVTKCPQDLSKEVQKDIIYSIRKYAGQKPVFFTSIAYGEPKPLFFTKSNLSGSVFLFSGIANDEELRTYVACRFGIVDTVAFYDHYHYTKNSIQKLLDRYKKNGQGTPLLTTEKDMVKLQPFASMFKGIDVYYLPIKVNFLTEEASFKELINDVVL